MCHYNFPLIKSLDRFNALTRLRIVAQDIDRIQGLEACTRLQHLWICEAKVTRIEGLDRCLELKSLHLYERWKGIHSLRPHARYMNQIRRLEGLDRLFKLEKLWLQDNGKEGCKRVGEPYSLTASLLIPMTAIERLENLDSLERLQDLHVGNNRIERIHEWKPSASLKVS